MKLWVVVEDCYVEYEASWEEVLGVYSSYENAERAMLDFQVYRDVNSELLSIKDRELDVAWKDTK